MSYNITGTTITLTRGDTFEALVSATKRDGTQYIPVEGDVIRFAMKENYDDPRPLLVKDIPIDTMMLTLEPQDTADLNFGKYVYDIAYDDLAAALKTLIDGKAAQATVDTLVGEDTGKSVRTISSEEVAKIVAGADKSYDTLKEIADWILSDTTGAAKMANDITRLDGILAGIGGTDEEATVVAYVTKMINALGIGDYVKTTTMTTELGKKVDKVEGSRLMTNAEGTKLAGIAAGAQANVIEKIKVNGVEVTPATEDKSIALTIPTGKLAGKDIVAETDLDAALKEKVNAAAEGNHSHANKAFLDTLSGATDEEVTAMCTEVFGA